MQARGAVDVSGCAMSKAIEVLDAFLQYARCAHEEEVARTGYEGGSWGYHGQHLISATSKAEDRAVKLLDEYINERIAQALVTWVYKK